MVHVIITAETTDAIYFTLSSTSMYHTWLQFKGVGTVSSF